MGKQTVTVMASKDKKKTMKLKGEGNSINYKFRMNDPRVGRFFAVDPLFKEYPYNSSYAFSENKVIDGVELEGLEYKTTKDKEGNVTGYEWDADNAFDKEGNLKDGYYEAAVVFKDNGTWKSGRWRKSKQRYESFNIGSAEATVYYSVQESQIVKDEKTGKESTEIITVPKQKVFKSTTMPSDPGRFATIAPGLYKAVRHKHQGKYWALQIKNLDGTGRIPILGGVNPATGLGYSTGINIHKAGRRNYTGTLWGGMTHKYMGYKKYLSKTGSYGGVSQACLLIDKKSWKMFMDIFPSGTGDIGVYVHRPKYTLPALKAPSYNPNLLKVDKWKIGIKQKEMSKVKIPSVDSSLEGYNKSQIKDK
ncbi:hypothetical protein [Tenacibaculum sp. MAR_2009_124]|uniref:hypothetical protein n=1 Tax=Tenacibaculum sp. MAR_2009_124 TaxID=1250059 RepID=UPI000AA5E99F|nr:hypothetical protein [Tenacibaculum sp. MAR_2009_124]